MSNLYGYETNNHDKEYEWKQLVQMHHLGPLPPAPKLNAGFCAKLYTYLWILATPAMMALFLYTTHDLCISLVLISIWNFAVGSILSKFPASG